MTDLDWKTPALIGGVVSGILSVIPVVNFANCCFCAWLVLGGAVASKMLIDRAPRPVRNGEGAQIGLVAGLIATGIYVVVNLLMIVAGIGEGMQRRVLEGLRERVADPEFQRMMEQIIEQSANQTAAQQLIGAIPVLIVFGIFYIGFSTLGGLLGVALFEKRRGQSPPPQQPPNYPPNYPPGSGGYGGGSYGGGQGGWPPSNQ